MKYPGFKSSLLALLLTCAAEGASGPPSILVQPASQSVESLTTVSFQVVADGTTPLSYQWLVNGQPALNGTGAIFTINSVCFTNSGTYQVVVTNVLGAVTSQVATLTVDADLTFRILELRTNAMTLLVTNVPETVKLRLKKTKKTFDRRKSVCFHRDALS